MNISATFIRKPIATGMLMAAILLLSLISYELLPVAALPNTGGNRTKLLPQARDLALGDRRDEQVAAAVKHWLLMELERKLATRAADQRDAETVDTKPAFREALQQRRCLVPVDNSYEWKKTATGKQPSAIDIGRPTPDGLGGTVGELALASRGMGSQLCDYHDMTSSRTCIVSASKGQPIPI
jgi:hypothetical protein